MAHFRAHNPRPMPTPDLTPEPSKSRPSPFSALTKALLLLIFFSVVLYLLTTTLQPSTTGATTTGVGFPTPTKHLRTPNQGSPTPPFSPTFTLIDLKSGGKVGVFCELDWAKHHNDPSLLPMFKDLVRQSKCDGPGRKRVEMPLAAALAKLPPSSPPPAGFVFHESRCGSTLVANLLTVASPSHRVYSESAPVSTALSSLQCSTNSPACTKLIHDVIALMSASTDKTFFKFQSALTFKMDRIIAAWPDTPWIFVLREPVAVLMSHLGSNEALTKGRPANARPNCARGKSKPVAAVAGLIAAKGLQSGSMSDEDYCAAYLAGLCGVAFEEIGKESGLGMVVDYEGVARTIEEVVMPVHFKVELGLEGRKRIEEIGGVYSKARKVGLEFEGDTEKKNELATKEIREASRLFLDDLYREMSTAGKQK